MQCISAARDYIYKTVDHTTFEESPHATNLTYCTVIHCKKTDVRPTIIYNLHRIKVTQPEVIVRMNAGKQLTKMVQINAQWPQFMSCLWVQILLDTLTLQPHMHSDNAKNSTKKRF